MKYQTLTLAASLPLIVGFSPPTTIPKLHHTNNAIHGRECQPLFLSNCVASSHRSDTLSSLPVFATKFRTAALFARPKSRFGEDDDDEDDDDDLDFEDDEEEDEDEDEGEEEDDGAFVQCSFIELYNSSDILLSSMFM